MIKITHFIACDIPNKGFERLFFFTEKNGKFYWGTDENSIGSIDIERWMKNGEVIELKQPIQIDDEEIIFIGKDDGPAIYVGKTIEERKIYGKVGELC